MQRLKSFRSMKEHQQDCELSSVLQNSMSMYGGGGGSVLNMHHPPPLHHQNPHQHQSGMFRPSGGGPPQGQQGQKLFNPHHPSGTAQTRGGSGVEGGHVPGGGGEGGGAFSIPPPQSAWNSSPNSSMPAYMRTSATSPGRQGGHFAQHSDYSKRSMTASNISRGDGGVQNMPSMLRSILRKENIDYENDFYWLSKVRARY
jgi:hypothetical protein